MKNMLCRALCVTLLALCVMLPAALAQDVITVYAADYDVTENGWYDTLEEVAIYLTEYDRLPENFITQNEAKALGWQSNRGNLWDVAYGYSIGGDRFGNYEGLLPDAKGRRWTECDIGFEGGYRGSERIVFSNDGLLYYTDDHYETFDEILVSWETADGYDAYGDYGGGDLMRELDDIVYWLFGE